MLDTVFFEAPKGWEIQAWLSLVTVKPDNLIAMQRLPHGDGTDPNQIAMMLYLRRTGHGGRGFFRHRSTGLESLTDETFPTYRDALQADVAKDGLPAAAYVSNGAPYFAVFCRILPYFAVFCRILIVCTVIKRAVEPLPQHEEFPAQ